MNQNQTLHWFACVGGDDVNNGNSVAIMASTCASNNNTDQQSSDNNYINSYEDNLAFGGDFVGGDEGIVFYVSNRYFWFDF